MSAFTLYPPANSPNRVSHITFYETNTQQASTEAVTNKLAQAALAINSSEKKSISGMKKTDKTLSNLKTALDLFRRECSSPRPASRLDRTSSADSACSDFFCDFGDDFGQFIKLERKSPTPAPLVESVTS